MRLKSSKLPLVILIIALSGALSVSADTISGGAVLTTWTGPGTGTTIGTAASPTTGGPYWNNPSADGPTANIGWCLAGGGSCALPGGAVGNLPYYSAGGTGAAPANMYFTSNNSGGATSTLLLSITNQKGGGNGIDNLYYYLTNSSGTIISSPIFLFSSASLVGTTASLSVPAGDGYGFELTNGAAGSPNPNTYLMNSTVTGAGLNTDPSLQHFVVFQQSTTSFYIGAEDGPSAGSDKDYNDLVIHLVSAPEPASILLLGGGLIAMFALLRRRNRNAAIK